MVIWMKVTADKFELPLQWAYTAQELARLCETTTSNVYSTISHAKHRKDNRGQFVKVIIEDD